MVILRACGIFLFVLRNTNNADLTNPHATIPDTAKVLPHSQATIVADMEVVGEEVPMEGTLSMEGVTKTMGRTMIQGVATTPTTRAIPTTTGETLGIDLSQRHVLPKAIPVIW